MRRCTAEEHAVIWQIHYWSGWNWNTEHCTLFVAYTGNFLKIDDDDTNTNDKDDNTYDKRYFGEGKLQYTKYLDSE